MKFSYAMSVFISVILCIGLVGCGQASKEPDRPDTVPQEPVSTPEEPEEPEEQFPNNSDGPDVYVDWSSLEPYAPEEPIYTRSSDSVITELVPSDNYGPLIPFLGDKLGGTDLGSRYGLITLSGEIVLDPVLSSVWDGGSQGGYYNLEPLPYFMLCKETPATSSDGWDEASEVWAMAARDGSWCTEFKYTMDGELSLWGRDINQNCTENGIFLLDGDQLVYLDGKTGEETMRVSNIPSEIGPSMALWGAGWHGDRPYIRNYGTLGWWIDPSTGELTYTEELPPADRLVNGKYVSYDYDSYTYTVYDESGSSLLSAGGIARVTWDRGDQFMVYDYTPDGWQQGYLVKEVYDAATMESVESPIIGKYAHWPSGIPNGWTWYYDGDDTVFVQGDEVLRVTAPGTPQTVWGRVALFSSYDNNTGSQTLVSLDNGLIADNILYTGDCHSYDLATGELYFRADDGRQVQIFDSAGQSLCTIRRSPSESVSLAGGLVLITGDSRVILRDLQGNIVFRYILSSGEWD